MGMIRGEYFGNAAAVEHGLWSLRQLRDMHAPWMVSEFNSPTYSPLTVAIFPNQHARKNEEARVIRRSVPSVLGMYWVTFIRRRD